MNSPDSEDFTRIFDQIVVEEFTEIVVHCLFQKAYEDRTVLNHIMRLVLLDSKARKKK